MIPNFSSTFAFIQFLFLGVSFPRMAECHFRMKLEIEKDGKTQDLRNGTGEREIDGREGTSEEIKLGCLRISLCITGQTQQWGGQSRGRKRLMNQNQREKEEAWGLMLKYGEKGPCPRGLGVKSMDLSVYGLNQAGDICASQSPSFSLTDKVKGTKTKKERSVRGEERLNSWLKFTKVSKQTEN